MFLTHLPVRLGRCFLLLLAGLAPISSSCFAQSMFRPVAATPYDRQMSRIEPVLHMRSGVSSALPVAAWMTALRAVPYQYSRAWRTPAEVGLFQTGDCKGKAVALYAEMRKSGAQNLRVVIGKRHIFDTATHAWLEWDTSAGRFVLDPTFNDGPTRAALLDPMVYVPFYAFDGAHKYRATGARVATRTETAMAAPASGNHFGVPQTTTRPSALHRASSVRGSPVRARRTHVVRATTLRTPVKVTASPQWPRTQW
jgi:hypothetical protein